MKANKPKMNHTKTMFFTFLAFSLEQSLKRDIEENISPKSVIKTNGTNHKETRFNMTGMGLRATAKT